jgi:hypothetical protein
MVYLCIPYDTINSHIDPCTTSRLVFLIKVCYVLCVVQAEYLCTLQTDQQSTTSRSKDTPSILGQST